MKKISVVLGLALVGACSTAMAQWQWLDKDGRKVFSDRVPPPDVMEKDIVKRPTAALRAPTAKEATPPGDAGNATADAANARLAPLPSGVDKELEAKRKQAADAEAAKKKVEEERVAKIRIENCARAKQSLASLDSGVRISRSNAAGEREMLDDASRAAERARVQGVMNSDCR